MAVGAVGLFLGMTGLYQLYFGGISGQTLGMRLMGIRLISHRGHARPGPARGLVRLLALAREPAAGGPGLAVGAVRSRAPRAARPPGRHLRHPRRVAGIRTSGGPPAVERAPPELANPVTLDAAMASRLSDCLVRDGTLPTDVVRVATARQAVYGGALDTALLELGAVDEPTLWGALADGDGRADPGRGVCSRARDPTAAAVFDAAWSRRCRAVPVGQRDGAVQICCSEPVETAQLAAARDALGLSFEVYVVPEVRLAAARQAVYGEPMPPRLLRVLARLLGAQPVRKWVKALAPATRAAAARRRAPPNDSAAPDRWRRGRPLLDDGRPGRGRVRRPREHVQHAARRHHRIAPVARRDGGAGRRRGGARAGRRRAGDSRRGATGRALAVRRPPRRGPCRRPRRRPRSRRGHGAAGPRDLPHAPRRYRRSRRCPRTRKPSCAPSPTTPRRRRASPRCASLRGAAGPPARAAARRQAARGPARGPPSAPSWRRARWASCATRWPCPTSSRRSRDRPRWRRRRRARWSRSRSRTSGRAARSGSPGGRRTEAPSASTGCSRACRTSRPRSASRRRRSCASSRASTSATTSTCPSASAKKRASAGRAGGTRAARAIA